MQNYNIQLRKLCCTLLLIHIVIVNWSRPIIVLLQCHQHCCYYRFCCQYCLFYQHYVTMWGVCFQVNVCLLGHILYIVLWTVPRKQHALDNLMYVRLQSPSVHFLTRSPGALTLCFVTCHIGPS